MATRMRFGSFNLEDTQLMNLSYSVVPKWNEQVVGGVRKFTNLQFYKEFDLTLGYLSKDDLGTLANLRTGSFTFYPWYDSEPSTSFTVVIDTDFENTGEFFGADDETKNVIDIRILEVDG